MASYNRIIIAGNLTRDPELKQVGGGSVCRLGLASNKQFKNRQTGAIQQEVCFVDIDVWGPQAESCGKFLQKGRPVLVEGRLKYDTWKDAEGNNRSRHSITADRVVFLGSRQDDDTMGDEIRVSAAQQEPEMVQSRSPRGAKTKKDEKDMEGLFKDQAPFEDDLPF